MRVIKKSNKDIYRHTFGSDCFLPEGVLSYIKFLIMEHSKPRGNGYTDASVRISISEVE